jgi:predicted O-methyltransferase YrrM
MIKALSLLFSFLLAISNLYHTPHSLISKSALLIRIIRNRIRVTSATGFVEQLAMISMLLRLPPQVQGSIVECGCYEGGSTTNLSLAAKLAGRKLYIFDSFRGLPEPKSRDVRHLVMNIGEYHRYEKGAWCGSLDRVRANVTKYGSPEACTFIEGYFDSTLTNFSESIALAFCDVDLRDSLETCLKYLWPLMSSGGVLFTHEAHHLEIASLFYDPALWPDSVPGLVGAGSGLGLSPMKDGSFGSCIGYTVKCPSILTESIESGKTERYKANLSSANSR